MEYQELIRELQKNSGKIGELIAPIEKKYPSYGLMNNGSIAMITMERFRRIFSKAGINIGESSLGTTGKTSESLVWKALISDIKGAILSTFFYLGNIICIMENSDLSKEDTRNYTEISRALAYYSLSDSRFLEALINELKDAKSQQQIRERLDKSIVPDLELLGFDDVANRIKIEAERIINEEFQNR